MLPPRKVQFEAKKRENENLRFRTFLKCNADEEKLDRQFKELHDELFAMYDCNRCRNCCKMYHGSIPEQDLQQDAHYLGMNVEEFCNKYLEKELRDGNYQTKHMPCDFLSAEGNCVLGECRPDSCKKFPYTDQSERLHSLYSVLDVIEVCPVAFEIFERLKKEYSFH